ncbi:MAG: LysR family transcriptional regulator, partial [Bdellovibrionales bacterium]|nr:LysR family transcriptional regulator [Oligoflexia bacterium]
IQQPALSRAIQNLESSLGFELFIRTKRSVNLTPEGEKVLQYCLPLFQGMNEIKALAVKPSTPLFSGNLNFGSSDCIATHLIPQTLRRLSSAHPGITSSILVGPASEIGHQVHQGTIDFGLVFADPLIKSMSTKTLIECNFVLVATPSYFSLPESRRKLIISREQDYSKRKSFPAKQMLKKANLSIPVAMESNNLSVQKNLILQGLGLGLLPEFFVQTEIKEGLLKVQRSSESFEYSIKLVSKAAAMKTPFHREFLRQFEISTRSLISKKHS